MSERFLKVKLEREKVKWKTILKKQEKLKS